MPVSQHEDFGETEKLVWLLENLFVNFFSCRKRIHCHISLLSFARLVFLDLGSASSSFDWLSVETSAAEGHHHLAWLSSNCIKQCVIAALK